MKNRISTRLEQHKNELRKRALKEQDEKLRRDYWWLYHNAKDIEPEVREMVLKAENRTMLERVIESGLMPMLLEAEKNKLPPEEAESEPSVADEEPPDHEDDIPPRQMGLWD
jgi:hypothetical protein